jgi:hypothetical protein
MNERKRCPSDRKTKNKRKRKKMETSNVWKKQEVFRKKKDIPKLVKKNWSISKKREETCVREKEKKKRERETI